MQSVIIEQEFKNLIPPQTPEEHAGLEAMIVAEGCREPLITWGGVLVDGHNRYEICTRLGLPFKTVEKEFEDRDAVCIWIIDNQLSRRNLPPYPRTQLALKKEEIFTKKAKEVQGTRNDIIQNSEGCLPEKIVAIKEVAKIAGVSHDTVARVKVIEEKATVEEKTALATGAKGISINSVYNNIKKIQVIEEKATEEAKAALTTGTKSIDEVISEIKEVEKAEKREEKREIYQQKIQQIQEAKIQNIEIPTPINPPTLVLADPPWRYDFTETKGREIENHYDTATVDDICDHSPDTADDCILLLWATAPKLLEAIKVMEAWGFKYKTSAIWDKEKIGMGYWFRGQHELLLVGTKGKVSPPSEFARVSSVFREARGNHSVKPECVYDWIESAFIDETKLEMYCRNPRSGWAVWGNEI